MAAAGAVNSDDLPHGVQVHLARDHGVDARGSEASVEVSVFFIRDLWGDTPIHDICTKADGVVKRYPKFADKYYRVVKKCSC